MNTAIPNKEKPMNLIAKQLLPEDVKPLVDARLLDDELRLTDKGRDVIWAELFKAHRAALDTFATEKLAKKEPKA